MEKYDLLIVADATYSMSDYLTSLNTSLPQILSISSLTGCFSRIGLIAYRDYCDMDTIKWSGWLDQSSLAGAQQHPDLVNMARGLNPMGGGDYPEAVKSALAQAYSVMRRDAKTLIFLFTDAPPHTNDPWLTDSNNPKWEREDLVKPNRFNGVGAAFVDWVSAAKTLRKGDRKAQVFAVLEPGMARHCAAYYNYLCTMTGGACIYLTSSTPAAISKTTVELLLAWMGVEKDSVASVEDKTLPANLSRYISIEGINSIPDEDSPKAANFFSYPYGKDHKSPANITTVKLSNEVMKKYLPKKEVPALNPANRWWTDPEYRDMAVQHLLRIINDDIQAITLNPVFGSLWRAVCNDRTYASREDVVNAFSQRVEKITNAEEKRAMKRWLDESYDYSAEVLKILEAVPEQEKFPCVFLDPTLDFSQADGGSNEDEELSPLAALTRADLLEIGRSCDPRVLRRLGRVLTRLSYARSASDLPEHIAKMANDQVPKIPVALTTQDHGRQFWRVLLHVIVPGTLLSSRAAALLAALTLRMGVSPLARAAEQEMLNFKRKWNDVDVPETWAVSCLTLLLSADDAYRRNLELAQAEAENEGGEKKPTSLLKTSDRSLFEQLVAFKTLEFNLDAPLTARVPWTPNKSVASIGPLAICRHCDYPRSVTIMGRGGKCGICLDPETDAAEYDRVVHLRTSKEITSRSEATWVECHTPTCRAQYIVYNVDGLQVRAKCFYCRKGDQGAAPVVECKQCLNRMIWPASYRPALFDESGFICPPCTTGRAPTTDLETTAKNLAVENTMSWLVRDAKNPDKDPFTNRSLFHTVSTIGTKGFIDRIKLFPPHASPLTQKGKPIRNTEELISTLQDLVAGRRAEQVDCSLCFSSFRPSVLSAACGRRGCLQRICSGCLKGWYGSNAAGRIVNTAALACPFCRRFPTPRTLAKHGTGIHAVRDLQRAIENKGTWIYAWCAGCFTAKELVERSCAQGIPPEITDWRCEPCRDTIEVERLARERRAIEQQLEDARIAQDHAAMEAAERRRWEIEDTLRGARKAGLKHCPGCDTLVERISGCGHITCPVPGCNTDWCYFCGKKFSESSIYRHMHAVHGGIMGDE